MERTKTMMINIEEVRRKLMDQLTGSGWRAVLKGILLSSEFEQVISALLDEVHAGRRFTPTMAEVFEAFIECPYDSLRVVIIGDEPYSEFGWASGIAFDCGNVNKEHFQLKQIFDSISEQYPGKPYRRNVDLKRWSHQGILLLNASLTTRIDKPGRHYEIWRPFIAYVLDILNVHRTDLVFVFMGDRAAEFADLIGDHHRKLYVEHPKEAKENEDGKWYDNSLFLEIDNMLANPIKW